MTPAEVLEILTPIGGFIAGLLLLRAVLHMATGYDLLGITINHEVQAEGEVTVKLKMAGTVGLDVAEVEYVNDADA